MGISHLRFDRFQTKEILLALLISIGFGLCIVPAMELRLIFQAALLLAFVGSIAFLFIPNKRLALTATWVFLLSLSVEKVFLIGTPEYDFFLPSVLIISAADMAFYLLFSLLLFEYVSGNKKAFVWTSALTPFFLLTLWVIIAFIIINPSLEGGLQIIHWVKMALFLFVFSSAIRTRNEFIIVLAVLALTVAFQSMIVGISYATGKQITYAGAHTNEFGFGNENLRATGTLGHANQQAAFHTFFTLPLIGLFWVKNRLFKLFFLGIAVASFCAIILTFSRTAWLSGVIAFSLIFFILKRKNLISRQILYLFGLLAIAGFLIFLVLSPKIVSRLFKGDDGASSSRWRLVATSLELITARPIAGVGPGNFVEETLKDIDFTRKPNNWMAPGERPEFLRVRDLEYTTSTVDDKIFVIPLHVHNKYLLILAELGLIGFILFLWFYWRIFKHLNNVLTLGGHDRTLWWTGLGLMGAMVAVLFYYTLDMFADDKTVLIPYFVAVLAITLDRIIQNEKRSNQHKWDSTSPSLK